MSVVAGCGDDSDPEPAGGSGGVTEIDPRVCGPLVDGGAADDPTCGGALAEPIENPALQSEIVTNLALSQTQQALHLLIGQYACGSTPVYRGTVSWGPAEDPLAEGQVRLEGASIAAIVDDDEFYGFDGDQSGRHLVISSSNEDLHAFVRPSADQPNDFEFSRPDASLDANGSVFGCSGCFAGLENDPDSIDFDFAAGSEFAPKAPGLNGVGTLRTVDPAELSWADLESLTGFRHGDWGTALLEFTECSNLRVRDIEERLRVEAPQVPGAAQGCFYGARYNARWWVDAQNFARHGVSNFAISDITYCCGFGEHTDTECFPIDG